MSDAAKVVIDDLIKIFGRDPKPALRALAEGRSREQIFASTGSVVAIGGVSFAVELGEIFVVMGLSGSGKSTLIRCLNRLIEPNSGRILFEGKDLLAASDEELRQVRLGKMAMVFQHFALFPHKTVAENVEFGLKAQGLGRIKRRERALTMLDQVGLVEWADKLPSALSGGMQQRVGLARSLAVNPELLLMDEPFSALDPLIRRDMQDELLRLQRGLRKTIIFITHDLHEALILGDRIAIMKDGRFVQVGTPQQIIAAPADDYVAAFTRDVDRGRVFTVEQVMKPALSGRVAESASELTRRLPWPGEGQVFVLDTNDRPVGVASFEELRCAASNSSVAEIMRPVATTVLGSHLVEIYSKCTRGQPIAVVDAEGRLVGSIDPVDLFPLMVSGARAE
jgi:glycine betaine/proline transport system ATP-binding protein